MDPFQRNTFPQQNSQPAPNPFTTAQGNNQQAGGNLFNQTGNPQGASGAFNQPTSSLFGQSASNPPNGSNLFSQAGNPLAANSLFNQTNNPAPATSNLFNQTNNPAPATSNLFNQTSNPSSATSNLFGQPSNPASATNSLFNQTSNPASATNSFFNQPSNPAPATSNLFGQSNSISNAAQLGNNTSTGNNLPFQSSSLQQASSTSNQIGNFSVPVATPFGASPLSIPSNQTSLFKSTPGPSTLQPQQSAISTFSQQSSAISQPKVSTGDNTLRTTPQPADQSSLISSMKDKSINLYNLTLQEIIDRHTFMLESNIKEFERDAQAIFQRDLQLIKSKNGYLSTQKKIEEENVKLDELMQVLEFFDERLNEIEAGEACESAQIINDFECICDRFFKHVETFKDEQSEVIDIINENYEIIENIDSKLDLLSSVRKLKY